MVSGDMKFAMMNDQTGEEATATLATAAEMQARGFRVTGINAYQSALAERKREQQEAAAAAAPALPDYGAQRVMADALLIAQKTFPDADGGPDGKGAEKTIKQAGTPVDTTPPPGAPPIAPTDDASAQASATPDADAPTGPAATDAPTGATGGTAKPAANRRTSGGNRRGSSNK